MYVSGVRVTVRGEESPRVGGPFDRLKSRDVRDCANSHHPPAAFPSRSLLLPSSSLFFLCSSSVPLHSTFPRKFHPFRISREGGKMWVGHVSLHFALLRRARRIGREIRSGWGTLYSVAELAGDFIEVDLDRSVVHVQKNDSEREKDRCSLLKLARFFSLLLFHPF